MKKHLTWISLITLFVLLIGGVLALNSLFTKNFNKRKSLSLKNIDQVSIKTEIINIHIQPSKDGLIHTKISGKASQFSDYDVDITSKNRTVEIKSKETNAGISSLSLNKTIALYVYLPEKEFQALHAESKFGKISADHKLFAKKLRLQTEIGNIQLHGFKGENLNIDANTGHIRISQLEGDANIHTSSGNVFINEWLLFLKKSHIRTNKGSIQIGITQVPESLSLVLQSNGVIKTNFDLAASKRFIPWKQWGMNQVTGNIGKKSKSTPQLTVSSDLGRILFEKK